MTIAKWLHSIEVNLINWLVKGLYPWESENELYTNWISPSLQFTEFPRIIEKAAGMFIDVIPKKHVDCVGDIHDKLSK